MRRLFGHFSVGLVPCFFTLFFILLVFFSCTKNNSSLEKKSQKSESQTRGVQRNDSLKVDESKEESVRICASVQSAEGEYIPLFNTNVFIKTSDENLADKIENELSFYHKLFDAHHYYYDESETGILKNLRVFNEYAAIKKNIFSAKDFSDLFFESVQLMKLSKNNFNIFLLPVSLLYDGMFSAFPIEKDDPPVLNLQKALEKVLYADDVEKNIFFSEGEFSFAKPSSFLVDFGGVAKGFAAKKIFEKYQDKNFLLSIGSSTIISVGRNSRIGIASPYYRTLPLFQINLFSGLSLSTSGTSSSYYILASDHKTIRTHILDSKTGVSNDWWWNVVVVSDNAFASDVLSTALFNVKELDEVRAIVESVKRELNCAVELCFVKDVSREEKAVALFVTNGFLQYMNQEYEGIGIVSIDTF